MADKRQSPSSAPPVRPHPLANEMVDRGASPRPEPKRGPNEPLLPRSERRVAGSILVVGLLLAVVGIVIASLLFKTTGLVISSIVFIVLIGLLFLWPVLAAHTVKEEQDAQAARAAHRNPRAP